MLIFFIELKIVLLFGNNFKRNFNRNFFVEFDKGFVASHFFYGFFQNDRFAINVESEFFQSFCDLNIVDRAEDGARGACFCSNGEAYIFQRFSKSFCVGLDFCELVCSLSLVFGQNFERRFGCNHSFSRRDKVISSVSAFDFNNIVFIAEVENMIFIIVIL